MENQPFSPMENSYFCELGEGGRGEDGRERGEAGEETSEDTFEDKGKEKYNPGGKYLVLKTCSLHSLPSKQEPKQQLFGNIPPLLCSCCWKSQESVG